VVQDARQLRGSATRRSRATVARRNWETRADSVAPGLDEPVRIGRRSRREGDHGDAPGRGVALQPLDNRQAVHLRHVVVDEDQVWALRPGQRQPVQASRGLEDVMSVGTEQLGERADDERVVVDDQDRELPRQRRLPAPGRCRTS